MEKRPHRSRMSSVESNRLQDVEGLTSVLIPLGVWQDLEGLSWIRLATPEERRSFISALRGFVGADRSTESLYHELKHDGRLQYVLVTLLIGTPKCILRKASEKIRMRTVCG